MVSIFRDIVFSFFLFRLFFISHVLFRAVFSFYPKFSFSYSHNNSHFIHSFLSNVLLYINFFLTQRHKFCLHYLYFTTNAPIFLTFPALTHSLHSESYTHILPCVSISGFHISIVCGASYVQCWGCQAQSFQGCSFGV